MSHPVEDVLLRYSVNDLSGGESEAVRAHVETCAACSAVMVALAAERTALLTRLSPASLVAGFERRRSVERQRRFRRLTGGGITAFAAAAALLFFLRMPPAVSGLKGGGLAVYVKRGETVRLLGTHDLVRPGDALRLAVTLDRRRLVRTWSVDDQGRVDALMPEPQRLGPGTIELDGSAVVEQPCVAGWLVVAVDDAARRGPDGKDRAQMLNDLAEGGFTQRVACESR